MTPNELAELALRIERPLRASLIREVLAATPVQAERGRLAAAVLTLMGRKFVQDIPGGEAVQREWLEAMVRGILA